MEVQLISLLTEKEISHDKIHRPDGSYAGTVTTTIGSIRENHIDTVIEMLTNYKKKIASPQREQTIGKIITFDFRNKFKKGGRL